jgi:hypothetical protein
MSNLSNPFNFPLPDLDAKALAGRLFNWDNHLCIMLAVHTF